MTSNMYHCKVYEYKGHLKETFLTNQYEILSNSPTTSSIIYNFLTYFVVLYRFVINNSTAQIIGSRDLV